MTGAILLAASAPLPIAIFPLIAWLVLIPVFKPEMDELPGVVSSSGGRSTRGVPGPARR